MSPMSETKISRQLAYLIIRIGSDELDKAFPFNSTLNAELENLLVRWENEYLKLLKASKCYAIGTPEWVAWEQKCNDQIKCITNLIPAAALETLTYYPKYRTAICFTDKLAELSNEIGHKIPWESLDAINTDEVIRTYVSRLYVIVIRDYRIAAISYEPKMSTTIGEKRGWHNINLVKWVDSEPEPTPDSQISTQSVGCECCELTPSDFYSPSQPKIASTGKRSRTGLSSAD